MIDILRRLEAADISFFPSFLRILRIGIFNKANSSP